jgi:antitoxin (DNA-binding transcriptional repressor) of toxin-antitoxin stability system
VTDRGRPVARLVPRSPQRRLEELEASGRLAVAEGDALELGPPLAPAAGVALPGETLAAIRSNER